MQGKKNQRPNFVKSRHYQSERKKKKNKPKHTFDFIRPAKEHFCLVLPALCAKSKDIFALLVFLPFVIDKELVGDSIP